MLTVASPFVGRTCHLPNAHMRELPPQRETSPQVLAEKPFRPAQQNRGRGSAPPVLPASGSPSLNFPWTRAFSEWRRNGRQLAGLSLAPQAL